MADDPALAAAADPAAAAAAAAAAVAAKPWYDGKADAETVGYWQNKGWKHDDPATVAFEATKAAREAQKFVGVPPDQLIRLPKDAKDEAGWNSVWQRLGVPKDAKEYDFSAVKRADGTAIDEAFADTIRQTAATNRIPKDAATAFAQSMVKHMEQQKAGETATAQTKWEASVERLKQNWGDRLEENKGIALAGTRRAGITQEEYDTMGRAVGIDRVAEMFRAFGAGTTEQKWVDGNRGAPATVETAQAELAELRADPAWSKRLFAGDAAAKRQFEGLTRKIAGVAS